MNFMDQLGDVLLGEIYFVLDVYAVLLQYFESIRCFLF